MDFMQPQDLYEYFGLYDDSTKLPVPLRKVLVDAKINEYLAEVTYSQTFYNPQETKIHTEYFFPISSEAAFHKFQARFGTVTIQGTVKEKKAARSEFEKYLKQGSLVAFATTFGKNSNVMSIEIGNIPPMSEVEITFSYIERVEIYMNKFWKFVIFAQFFPPSPVNSPKTQEKETEKLLENVKDSERIIWEISVVINSRSPISFVKSTSHDTEITRSGLTHCYSAKVWLASEKRYIPDKDFVLLYTTNSINKPHYMLSPFEYGHCMLFSFAPTLSHFTFDDAFLASLEGKDPIQELIFRAKREYIFVVDECHSKDKAILSLIKETLLSFIQKLPDESSYLNILGLEETASFSSSRKSVETTEDSLQDFVEYVKKSQDYGTTSLENLIKQIKQAAPIQDYTRKVFILTSKQSHRPINNTVEIMRSQLAGIQIFVLEIRPSSFWDYFGKVSIENKSTHEIIKSREEIQEKVSYLLRNSLLPNFTDFDLKFDNEDICAYVIPLPKALSHIAPGKLIEFFIIFNKMVEEIKKTSFTLKFFNTQNNRDETFKGEINFEESDLSEAVIKLGMLKFCDSLSAKIDIFTSMDNRMAKEFKKDISNKLLSTSLKYGILTEKTAFVCMIKEGNDALQQIPTKKITISQKRKTFLFNKEDDLKASLTLVPLVKDQSRRRERDKGFKKTPKEKISEPYTFKKIELQSKENETESDCLAELQDNSVDSPGPGRVPKMVFREAPANPYRRKRVKLEDVKRKKEKMSPGIDVLPVRKKDNIGDTEENKELESPKQESAKIFKLSNGETIVLDQKNTLESLESFGSSRGNLMIRNENRQKDVWTRWVETIRQICPCLRRAKKEERNINYSLPA